MPDQPVPLPVDRHRIREMLLNLVTNAIKYTPQGGTVDLNLAEQDGAVTITVRDTGIGIAPGDLPHIFERFWRADPARSRTGAAAGHRARTRHHQVDRGGARGVDHRAEPAGARDRVHGAAAEGRGAVGDCGRWVGLTRLTLSGAKGTDPNHVPFAPPRVIPITAAFRFPTIPPSRLPDTEPLIPLSSNCHVQATSQPSGGW